MKNVFLVGLLYFFPFYAFSAENCRLQTEQIPDNAIFTLHCAHLDLETQDALNTQFQQLQAQLSNTLMFKDAKQTNAKNWVARYNDLSKNLESLKNITNAKVLTNAKTLLKQGNFSDLAVLLDTLKTPEGKKTKQNAKVHFMLGQVYLLDNKPVQALPMLKVAYDYFDNIEYGVKYAELLQEQNEYEASKQIYKDLLKRLKQHPDEKQQDTLLQVKDYLAFLYTNTEEPAEAEKLYREILKYYRKLAKTKTNATYCLCELARTLGNLANLISEDPKRNEEAEQGYKESLEIYKKLAKTDPIYHAYVAKALINLSHLIAENPKRTEEAKQGYKESLEIYKALAKIDPAYNVYVADMLFELAVLATKAPDCNAAEVEQQYQEALIFYRDAAKTNPAYYAYVADTLYNLALMTVKDPNRKAEAEQQYQEALIFYRTDLKCLKRSDSFNHESDKTQFQFSVSILKSPFKVLN
ncbi:hypothetical protein BegalDRAFT_2222 [Beggiatoa alba B18LD]|uniref:Tetratricopeptide repeat protein n=1 Tax=Beggiatoa alba B18LD TaxID=395493 RepID=I3CHI5_9GAMM|nr:tetratricopeptide repeat protein [Beggiatoa alba]EIJ43078.1 hypothetical protein BegalDRAFT_2222 [Beggiatoa alba B18LD]